MIMIIGEVSPTALRSSILEKFREGFLRKEIFLYFFCKQ
jgi:hypothetical protein